MGSLQDVGWPARIALVCSFAPLLSAAMYAIRPARRTVAVTIALSVMSLFAGLGATVSGCVALLHDVGGRAELHSADLPWVITGLSERLVTSSAALWGLAGAGALVAIGRARRPHRT
jgi:hypothetical protein